MQIIEAKPKLSVNSHSEYLKNKRNILISANRTEQATREVPYKRSLPAYLRMSSTHKNILERKRTTLKALATLLYPSSVPNIKPEINMSTN